MASTYSTNLALELIGTGDQAGTWGVTTNTNLGTLLEQAISGYVTQAVSTGTDTTITIPNGSTGVARNMYIELTGTGGTNTNLIVPANKKLYFIFNNASGAVTVKVSGQTGVSVPAGKKMILVSNGTDIVNGVNYIADFGTNSFTVTNLTATSATITNLIATTATVSDLSATVLRAASASITNLALTSLTISSLSITNVSVASATVSSNLTLSGGTANGVLYLNGSKVATSAADLTFTSTGLGIGTASPGQKLDIITDSNAFVGQRIRNNDTGSSAYAGLILNPNGNSWGIRSGSSAANSNSLNFTIDILGTPINLLTLTASGNLGLGVTPSAGSVHMDISNGGSVYGLSTGAQIAGNAAFTGGVWAYRGTGKAARIDVNNADSGGIAFSVASVQGTAGNTISFTQAMTLDASGNLGIGATSPSVNGIDIVKSSSTPTYVRTSDGTYSLLSGISPSLGGGLVGTTTNHPVLLYANNTERARITSGGDLLVGGTSQFNSSKACVVGSISSATSGVDGTYTPMLFGAYSSATSQASAIAVSMSSIGTNCGFQFQVSSGVDANRTVAYQLNRTQHIWSVGGAEAARITSGGKFCVNAADTQFTSIGIFASTSSGQGNALEAQTETTGNFSLVCVNKATSGDNAFIYFGTEAAGTQRGSITYNRGAGQVAYNVTSDARLKDNIADATDAGNKVDALQVRQFDWKETGNHVEYGFVAQELNVVAPHAVTKPEDEEAMWSVDYSKLVPMLVKEIQSLRARVAQLESK
jgi:hypothetical protein